MSIAFTTPDHAVAIIVCERSPMVPSRIFRNRWSALFWSAGILWTAYDVAMANRGSAPVAANAATPVVTRDATGEAVDPNDLAILANAAG